VAKNNNKSNTAETFLPSKPVFNSKIGGITQSVYESINQTHKKTKGKSYLLFLVTLVIEGLICG
jgi:cytochrome c oxidase assembly protein Cox11